MTAPVVRRSPVRRARVVAVEQLTPRMRRVSIRCADMVDIPIRPAQDVELHLREESGRRVKRRYTIRTARTEVGEYDLDFLLHGGGPGAAWGAAAAPDDEVDFQGPRGKLELRPARHHVLVGDESALPAIAAIAEALPPGEQARAVLEVRDGTDELPVPADTRWVHRGEHPPGTADLLLPAVDELGLPGADVRAYLLGETRTMVALRAALEARGVDHDAIFVKGYWNIARPDRIAGRPPR